MAELFHSRSGQGEPLLILHGLFGSSRNWQSLARQYAEHFDVLSVDLRNHGQSFHSAQMDYALMADDVRYLVTKLGLHNCKVIGHSMGGKVALQFAIEQPELVERIVVVDIAPVDYQHDHHAILDALMAVEVEMVHSRADADEQLKASIPEAPLRAFLLQNLVRQEGRWGWRVNLEAVSREMAALTGFNLPENRQVDVPALFVFGTRSDYVGAPEQAIIRQQFPRATLQPMEGAGHWLHAEQPQQFFELSSQFLLS